MAMYIKVKHLYIWLYIMDPSKPSHHFFLLAWAHALRGPIILGTPHPRGISQHKKINKICVCVCFFSSFFVALF
jgi:hypothetical protein